MNDKLKQIAALAQSRRVARLTYKRPGEFTPHDYLVEPYRLQRTPGGLAVHAWQLSPPPQAGRDGWRDFRLDRITLVADGGQAFQPRMPLTLPQEAGGPAPAAGHPAVPAPPNPVGGPAPITGRSPEAFHEWGERPVAKMGPAEDYFRYLEDAMLDAKVTPEEMTLARSLGDRVEPHERKAVHARVYANVLHEVVQDARISHREEIYLRTVRDFLEKLGWAP
jgi:hypothetical protein